MPRKPLRLPEPQSEHVKLLQRLRMSKCPVGARLAAAEFIEHLMARTLTVDELSTCGGWYEALEIVMPAVIDDADRALAEKIKAIEAAERTREGA